MDELTLAVVGLPFANDDGSNRMFEVLACAPGDAIELRPNPNNKFDEHAIEVWRAGGGQMGLLTAERAPFIGRRLGEGYEAIYQGHAGSAAYVRVRFGGGAPTLPSPNLQGSLAGSSPTGDDDFYPDPEGSEWGA